MNRTARPRNPSIDGTLSVDERCGGRAVIRVVRAGQRYPEAMAKAHEAVVPEPLRAAAQTFDDYLRVERGALPSTVEAYRRDLRMYLKALAASGVHEVADVTSTHVIAALSERARRGPAASTLNRF